MSDFYIVPPRLIVGSLDRSNVVTSLNTLRGDLSFKVNPETGLTLNIASGIFTFSILPDFYVKKSGDTAKDLGNVRIKEGGILLPVATY